MAVGDVRRPLASRGPLRGRGIPALVTSDLLADLVAALDRDHWSRLLSTVVHGSSGGIDSEELGVDGGRRGCSRPRRWSKLQARGGASELRVTWRLVSRDTIEGPYVPLAGFVRGAVPAGERWSGSDSGTARMAPPRPHHPFSEIENRATELNHRAFHVKHRSSLAMCLTSEAEGGRMSP